MPTCSHCNKEISCPEHAHSLIPLQPCESQICSIWVRAVDHEGRPVAGVTAEADGHEGTTGENGFAKLEDLSVGQHVVSLGLDDTAAKKFLALDPATRQETLAPGDLKLLVVRLRPRVKPVLRISKAAVLVGGKLTLTLETDRPYTGTGTLTCLGGNDAIDLEPPLQDGRVDFAQAVGGKQEFTITTKAATGLDGIAFEWKLDAASQLGDPATAKATAVKVTLEPHQGQAALDAQGKVQAPGLVVHVQDQAKTRRRAKVGLVVQPAEFVGEVELAVAGGGDVTLWKEAQAGDPLALDAPVPVGPDHPKAYFLEGARVSQAGGDVTVTAKLRGFAEVADRFVASVVRTKLVAYADRTGTRKDDPVAIADARKLDPGQVLVRQVGRIVQRTKLEVTKEPADVACKLRLVAAKGADKVRLFQAAEEVVVNQANDKKRVTFENVREGEGGPLDLGAGIDLSAGKDANALVLPAQPGSWTFWLAGAAVSDARAVELQLDIEDVDVRCDAVAYTVADPELTLELVRSDTQPLGDAVDVKLVAVDGASPAVTGTIPANTGRVAIRVPAGYYRVELAPKGNVEKPMRVCRLLPKSSDAALDLRASATAKYELAPAYTKVQLVALCVYTGQSRGIDATKASHDDRIAEARKDMKAKAALMKDAIQKAAARVADIDAARTTLKVFMAPEFYFRGQQGAYPMEVVSEILAELDGEISQDAYQDWLFVLGTAIGVVTPPQPVPLAKKITATFGQPYLDAPLNVTSFGMGSPNLRQVGFWITYGSVARPAVGWAMLSPFIGSVVNLGYMGPPQNGDWICVEHNVNQGVNLNALVGQQVRLEEPAEAEIVNVAIVRKGGSAAPSGADGRGLRELLIEKEYVSWNDLPTPVDDGQGRFFEAGRQLITIFGQTCRAKPPQGSFMPQYFGWGNVPNLNLSEVNTSGMGGGSVFTIDRIAFGLEVCMDHGMGSRLRRYYSGSGGIGTPQAKSGEPKLQVQLVPSGGMSIQPFNICTVVNGLVFNVDMSHHAAKKATGPYDNTTGVPTAPIATKGVATTLALDASAHFDTTKATGNGQVIVYAAADLPPPETVA